MDNTTVEAVTQLPWPAVITGLAGLIGALGGSLLTNRFAEKRWDKQVSLESVKESKRLLREKGEDTFLALTMWQKEIYFFYVARLGFLQGAISGEKLDEVVREKISTSTHGKVDVLVKLYFPDFKSDVESIFKKLDECNRVFGLSESQKLTKTKALEMMIPLVTAAEDAMQSLIDQFCESLSSKII